MTTTTITTISAALAIIPAAAAAYHKLAEVLAPLLRRRALVVRVLAPAAKLADATAFAARLRACGYRDVTVTTEPAAVVSAQVVVTWECDAKAAMGASAVAPEATVCVLTYEPLQGLPRGPKWLVSNSPTRLQGDLSAIAESR